SDRLRIADVRPSIHFIADDFLRFALKPACALPPFPARAFGVQPQVPKFPVCRHNAGKADWYGHPWRPSTVT
ncbi:MAG: hypothetical protein WA763_22220, partial [Pseudolabrys sp.]